MLLRPLAFGLSIAFGLPLHLQASLRAIFHFPRLAFRFSVVLSPFWVSAQPARAVEVLSGFSLTRCSISPPIILLFSAGCRLPDCVVTEIGSKHAMSISVLGCSNDHELARLDPELWTEEVESSAENSAYIQKLSD